MTQLRHADLVHGDELAKAAERAGDTEAIYSAICRTAFDRVVNEMVDETVEGEVWEGMVDKAKVALLAGGIPLTAEAIMGVVVRGALGGAYSYGVATGLEIARGRGWDLKAAGS